MKITIVTGPFLPCGGGPAGAIEKRWFGVATRFVECGHQVTIVARAWAGQASDEVVAGVRMIRRSGFARSSSLKRDLIKDLLYSIRALTVLPPADITVINAFWLPLLACRFKGRLGKLVVNVARFPKHQMGLYRWTDRLSAVSRAVAEEIVRQTPSVERLVAVVPNPVDIDRFRPSAKRPPREGTYRILYTGRVHPEKGLHLLISAIRPLLSDYAGLTLSVVGPTRIEYGGGGDAYLAELRRLSEGLPVRFEASIENPLLLAQRMAEADYYCYPSLADQGESFGVAPLEAMALGYAPILSQLPCFGEFAEEGVNCFLFDHHHPNPIGQLTAALRRAFQSPDRTREMGSKAIETAQSFRYEKVADAYLLDWELLLRQVKK